MRKIKKLIILTALVLMVVSCNPFDKKDSIYKRPDWLAGKLYTQLKAEPSLSTFTKCVELIGYDSIINISGSYTIFAPNNEAFDIFFQEHPEYNNSVDNVPLDELSRIVKYHILQNAWSYDQLTQLDIYGWIDTTDENNDEANGYKRETLLRDPDRKYGVANSGNERYANDVLQLAIVDTLSSPWYRRQYTDSRKYAPLFYQEYFDLNDLTGNDYEFYFNRTFDPSQIYYVGAEIVEHDIFAENGFIHIIDRVVEPLKSAYQILDDKSGTYSYSKFLDMVNKFPEFSYNESKTEDQPGVDQGLKVDSLFDITYTDLAFNISDEKTKSPKGSTGLPDEVTIRYHHGLVAPTNEAVAAFENEYLVGSNKWGSFAKAPTHIRRMFVNTHMSENSIYPSDFSKGFVNGEDDEITLDASTIIQKQYGSNCTFIGVNEAIVPRAFSSITGPIYLNRGYSRVMYAIENSGLLYALKRKNMDFSFFVESDANLMIDSSLIYDASRKAFRLFAITEYTRNQFSITTSDLRSLIMNHVGVEKPTGLARKEFIPNLAGNYIIINNETGEVRGSATTKIGYQGATEKPDYPVKISTNSDNGSTYEIENWLCFSSAELYALITNAGPQFQNLLTKAGLYNTKTYSYAFMSETEHYTVFVPSDAALAAYNTSALSTEELKQFCLMFFIPGHMIFTDGRETPGYYETGRVDEKSTQYTTIYTKLYIDPEVDKINFRRTDGTNYLTVDESSVTNQMAARILNDTESDTYPTISTYAVIHKIEKVLLKSELDTE
jgi:uncharacterized surface protein with fasciclin (FAS1) repeats